MRILVAEDDMTSRLFMRKFLERFGDCDVAANGLQAIDMAADALKSGVYYDLICLDVMMPKVDGVKALKAIRELEKTEDTLKTPAKVIMTTALNDKATVDEAYEYGAQAYAWKPIDIVKFREVMESLELFEG